MFLACPLCQKPLDVPGVYAGHVMKCGHCQGTFTVPEVPGTRPPEAQPVAAPPADPPAGPSAPTTNADETPLSENEYRRWLFAIRDQPRDELGRWVRPPRPEERNEPVGVPPPSAASSDPVPPGAPPPLEQRLPETTAQPAEQSGSGQGESAAPPGPSAWKEQYAQENAAAVEALKAWDEAGADPASDPTLRMLKGRANYLKVLAGLRQEDKLPEVTYSLLKCPACGQANQVPDYAAHTYKTYACAACGQHFAVPPRDGEAPPSATEVVSPPPPSAPEAEQGVPPPPSGLNTGEQPAEPSPGGATDDAQAGASDPGPGAPAFTQEDIDRALAEQAAYRQERKRQFAISELQGRQGELSPQVEKARAARMARNRSRRGAAQRRVAGRLGLGGIYQAIDFGQDVLTAFGRNDEGTSDPEREMLAELKAIAEKLDVLASIQSGDGASLAERNVGESDDRQPAAGGKPNATSSPTARAARALNDPTLSLLARAFQGPAQRPSQQAGPAQPGGGRNNWIGELLRFLGM